MDKYLYRVIVHYDNDIRGLPNQDDTHLGNGVMTANEVVELIKDLDLYSSDLTTISIFREVKS